MTDELMKKATLYADEHCEDQDEDGFWLSDMEMLRRAYIAGAEENGIVWHDLRKDPNDLPPPQDNTSISDYVITDRGVGYYNGRVKSWWVKNDCALTDKVIAWCEIPKFEVEE